MKLSPLCTRLLGSTPFLKLLVACKHDLKARPIISSKINQLTFTNALAALDRRVSGKWVLSDIGAAVKCARIWVSLTKDAEAELVEQRARSIDEVQRQFCDDSAFIRLAIARSRADAAAPDRGDAVKAQPVADGGDGGMDATRKDLSVPESNAQPVRDADETGIDVSLDTSLNTSRDVLSVSEAEAESAASRNRDILPLLKSVAGEWNAHLNRIADSCADIAARLGAIASESLLQDAQHEKASIFGRTPSDAALAVAIVRHVRACDPGTLSAKHIRFQLEEEFACNLVARIDFIRNHIQAVLHDSEVASCAATQAEPSDADEMVAPFQPQPKRRRADKSCIKDEHGIGRSTKRARSSSAVVAASLPPRPSELRSKNSDPFIRPLPKQVKSNQVSSYRFNASMSDAGAFVHRL